MGYHNPKIKNDEGNIIVNLRNRIINLYNKLYSNNIIPNMMMSRINSISLKRSNSQ